MDQNVVKATLKTAFNAVRSLAPDHVRLVNGEIDNVTADLVDVNWSHITKFNIDWEIVRDADGHIVSVLPKITIESETP